jgi:hypothetical protein
LTEFDAAFLDLFRDGSRQNRVGLLRFPKIASHTQKSAPSKAAPATRDVNDFELSKSYGGRF